MDQKLQNAIETIQKFAIDYETRVKNLPSTNDEVEALLTELAEAENQCLAHFKKFPNDGSDEFPPEARKNWHTVYTRREAAVMKITNFALEKYKKV